MNATNPNTPDPEYATIPEAAKVLRISETSVRRRVRDGSLPARRLGRLVRIPRGLLSANVAGGLPVDVQFR